MNRYIKFLAIGIITFGCNYEPPAPAESKLAPVTPGSADFTKFVAIGNSLTAGFMDGALYEEGQKNSYAAILAGQMKAAGGGEYGIPILPSPKGNGVNSSFPGAGRLVAALPACQKASISPVPSPGDYASLADLFNPSNKYQGTINQFGVPGVKLIQVGSPLLGNTPNGNPFYVRIASNPGTSTLVGDAVAVQPTFFSIWLGNNDVLGYALSGGAGNPNPDPTNPAAIKANDMTPKVIFAGAYSNVLNAFLSVPNSKGVVANIPDVTSIPYFNTINPRLTAKTTDACNPSAPAKAAIPFQLDAQTAGLLNAKYAGAGYTVSAGYTGPFNAGDNYPVIVTGDGTVRQMNPAKDFLTLTTPTDSLLVGVLYTDICNCTPKGKRAGWGLASGLDAANPIVSAKAKPIPTQYILDEGEIALVQARTNEFNETIQALVTPNADRVALVDINQLLKTLKASGISADGVTVVSALGVNSGFSWDGVHPNPKGYAIIANEFIKVINSAYKSTLRPVDTRNYRGQEFPIAGQ